MRAQPVSLSSEPDGTIIYLGRHGNVAEKHLKMTGGRVEGDYQLSTKHLALIRQGDTWILRGPSKDIVPAKVQYWGTGRERHLTDKREIAIAPGEYLSALVETESYFYWALISRPDVDRVETPPDKPVSSRRITLTINRTQVEPELLTDPVKSSLLWRYRDYLVWPMHPRPMLRSFPTTGTLTWQGETVNSSALKRRAQDLCRYLQAHHSDIFPFTGVDLHVPLLEWLVDNDVLKFDDVLVEW
ncbi:hypothetical protein KUG88_25990 [Rhodococcus rhodochrous]|uniref:hypothetical protein n=1 Tax=Rhodococcus rhodochrous TaxID=1829 RepID=UPI001E5660B1|nr:hypothetical protein [Rhodococcus rhodochrous]MCB8913572.1 hypothetical protein [Rhodococcus rhodochrous]